MNKIKDKEEIRLKNEKILIDILSKYLDIEKIEKEEKEDWNALFPYLLSAFKGMVNFFHIPHSAQLKRGRQYRDMLEPEIECSDRILNELKNPNSQRFRLYFEIDNESIDQFEKDIKKYQSGRKERISYISYLKQTDLNTINFISGYYELTKRKLIDLIHDVLSEFQIEDYSKKSPYIKEQKERIAKWLPKRK